MKNLWIAIILLISANSLWAKKVAILVGVDNIKGAGQLPYTHIDINIMTNLLNEYNFDSIIPLTGDKATLEEIRIEFNKLYKDLNKDDTFLFYYSGHGAMMKGARKNSEDNIFLLNQAHISNETIKNGVLTDKEFSNLLYKIEAKKISIIDACHSGSIYKGIISKRDNTSIVKSFPSTKGLGGIYNRGEDIMNFKKKELNNFVNISAAKDSELTEESPEGSVFTLTLIKVIKNNPNITLKELETKVQNQTKKTALAIARKHPSTKYAKLKGKAKPVLGTMPKNLEGLRVKDVFSNSTNFTLERAFNNTSIPNTINLSITSDKKIYTENDLMIIKVTSSSQDGYLYLFEKKGDTYYFLEEKKLKKFSKFNTIYPSKPFGKTIIYSIATKNKLQINKENLTKDFKITNDFFDGKSLAEQLKQEQLSKVKLELCIKKDKRDRQCD